MNKMQSIEYLRKFDIAIDESTWEENSKKTVVVGMSGGVDSSVCAVLCQLQGYNTVGIFMKNWEEIDADGVCTAQEDYEDVVKVCSKLNIPYYSVNFSQEYRDNVFKSFVEDYKKGLTPNPDILCNREIKFNVFLKNALEFGADYLATGHYCQNINNELHKGVDSNKDQTYFLYTINSKILEKVIFPVGSMEKSKVREIAKDFDLATQSKKDSTGICFIGERNFKDFLSNYIASQTGSFINLENGKNLGQHDGMCFYTIGQRKGMGIGGPGGPWFVAKKDFESNIVYVVEGEKHPALYNDFLLASEESWVGAAPEFPFKCQAKIRYRQEDQECSIERLQSGELKVSFIRPQRAIGIRQSIVFYDQDNCLGGAIITESGPSYYEQKKTL